MQRQMQNLSALTYSTKHFVLKYTFICLILARDSHARYLQAIAANPYDFNDRDKNVREHNNHFK